MKLLALGLFIMPFLSLAQTAKDPSDDDVKKAYQGIPKDNGEYVYSEVVQVDTSVSKDELYKRAKVYFTNAFKSAKEVLQYDDRGEGKIIGKGNFQLEDGQSVFLSFMEMKYVVNFSLEIFCKDGKYRYRIYAIGIDYQGRASGGNTVDNLSNGSYGVDDAYKATLKGVTKKMYRRLFVNTTMRLQLTAQSIKEAMSHATSKDDF